MGHRRRARRRRPPTRKGKRRRRGPPLQCPVRGVSRQVRSRGPERRAGRAGPAARLFVLAESEAAAGHRQLLAVRDNALRLRPPRCRPTHPDRSMTTTCMRSWRTCWRGTRSLRRCGDGRRVAPRGSYACPQSFRSGLARRGQTQAVTLTPACLALMPGSGSSGGAPAGRFPHPRPCPLPNFNPATSSASVPHAPDAGAPITLGRISYPRADHCRRDSP
jgi:hypothetical protein